MLLLLPDSPTNARFLSARERTVASERVRAQLSTKMDNTWRLYQLVEALKDPQAWLLVLYTFAVNIGNGGLTSVSGSVRMLDFII